MEKLTQTTQRHFKLFRPPFVGEISGPEDVYMSEEHIYIQESMLEVAENGGFLAVTAEVGGGKSTIRRKVVEQLKNDKKVLIIFPQILDKTRVSAGSLCEAIIKDLSPESKIPQTHEAKARKVQKLLMERAAEGFRACLIIEEAHDLTASVLKLLKRLQELEYGMRKLIGVILIGQNELELMLDEGQNPGLREVIRRVQLCRITGLNGGLKPYLEMKFRRCNTTLERIITEDALETLSERLSVSGPGRRRISTAYPLTVNNAMTRAMNLAVELGEEKVTVDVINAL